MVRTSVNVRFQNSLQKKWLTMVTVLGYDVAMYYGRELELRR
jgi:hypothetical protein